MRGSLALRVSLAYALLVLLSVSVLLVMIFENQMDLIAQNATLRSRLLGQQLGVSLSEGDLDQLDDEFLDTLGIAGLVVYEESGEAIRTIRDIHGAVVQSGGAIDPEVLRYIGMALARQNFEFRSF